MNFYKYVGTPRAEVDGFKLKTPLFKKIDFALFKCYYMSQPQLHGC